MQRREQEPSTPSIENAVVRSPESNGMSESFVKILKRDYVRLHVLADAETILAVLPDWIVDFARSTRTQA